MGSSEFHGTGQGQAKGPRLIGAGFIPTPIQGYAFAVAAYMYIHVPNRYA